ncbi:MAG: MerR family transcriptional regulator, partial [Pseudoclavibacter sp.]
MAQSHAGTGTRTGADADAEAVSAALSVSMLTNHGGAMKLAHLSERSGASTATIKYWIREGMLAPGRLRNQTTAVYDASHLERIELIRTLRERFDLPIAEVRRVTSLIDDPSVSLLDVMEACQLIATGLRHPERAAPGTHADAVDEMVRRAGWPDVPTVARDAMAEAIREAADAGFAVSSERLASYATGLFEIAAHDVGYVRRGFVGDASFAGGDDGAAPVDDAEAP